MSRPASISPPATAAAPVFPDLPGRRVLVSGAVGALWLFGAFAVAGYATFGLNPALLVRAGEYAAWYGPAFAFFSRGQVWLAGAVLALLLVHWAGLRWLPAFAAVYALSLASELAGTTWGLPFGAYAYTPLLGVQWLERVPVLIPLSWFCMAVPSYAFAALRFGRAGHTLPRILLGSLILLVWDLTLDPAMSHATPYWTWGESGPYYGMPLLNLVGWYVTGLVLMAALARLRAERWLAAVPPRLLAAYYGANLLVPFGMCVAAGLWGAVALSGVLLAGLALYIVPFAARPRAEVAW